MAVYTVRVSFAPGAVDLDFLTQAYFTVLAEVMGREPLSDPPRRREGKSDYGPPPWKSRTYGGTKYGLRARDDLLFTGHGVYGEKTRWTLRGPVKPKKIYGHSSRDFQRSSGSADLHIESYIQQEYSRIGALFLRQF